MLIVREAGEGDAGALGAICDLLDFDDLSSSLAGVHVLDDGAELLGLLRIEKYGDVCYLSEVGIVPHRRREGFAARLLDGVLPNIDSDVYLYTVIPEFFRKFGFEVATPSTQIPTREEINCEGCEISKCECMVR